MKRTKIIKEYFEEPVEPDPDGGGVDTDSPENEFQDNLNSELEDNLKSIDASTLAGDLGNENLAGDLEANGIPDKVKTNISDAVDANIKQIGIGPDTPMQRSLAKVTSDSYITNLGDIHEQAISNIENSAGGADNVANATDEAIQNGVNEAVNNVGSEINTSVKKQFGSSAGEGFDDMAKENGLDPTDPQVQEMKQNFQDVSENLIDADGKARESLDNADTEGTPENKQANDTKDAIDASDESGAKTEDGSTLKDKLMKFGMYALGGLILLGIFFKTANPADIVKDLLNMPAELLDGLLGLLSKLYNWFVDNVVKPIESFVSTIWKFLKWGLLGIGIVIFIVIVFKIISFARGKKGSSKSS